MSESGSEGRVLSIDYGRRRIGAAVSDPTRTIATPLENYERTTPGRDAAHYRKLVQEERVRLVVVGLPVHTSGREGELAKEAQRFGSWLQELCEVPVVFRDERYTSKEAEDILRGAGVRPRDRKSLRDRLAAQLLLQAFLDAGCPLSDEPIGPLNGPAV
jgi:putative Holliday junction resolvase